MKTKLDITDENILFFAMRYALGRKTCAPEIVVGKIEELWQSIRPYTREMMHREISHAIFHGVAGDPCDVETWSRVLRLT
jgi:hypothetical protein